MTSRFNYVLFGVACLSGIAFRTVMLLFLIDPSSGFIHYDYSSYSLGLVIPMIAAGAVIFGLTLFSKKNKDRSPSLLSIPFFVACVILAIAIGYETFFSPLLSKSNLVQTIIQYLFTTGSIVSLLLFAVFGYLKKPYPGVLTLLPICCFTMRLIIVFTDFSTISTISETVIETIAMCLTLVTVLFFSKIVCEQIKPNKYVLVASTALLNAYVCAVGSIPRIIADIFSLQQPIHMNLIPSFTGLAIAIFSAAFGFTVLHSIQADKE